MSKQYEAALQAAREWNLRDMDEDDIVLDNAVRVEFQHHEGTGAIVYGFARGYLERDRAVRGFESAPDHGIYSWCHEHGVNVKVDEDGCCATCGIDAHADGLASTYKLVPIDAPAQEPRVVEVTAEDWRESKALTEKQLGRTRSVPLDEWDACRLKNLNARLRARAKPDDGEAMSEAMRAVHDWRGMCDGSTLETWERIAEMFRRDTGFLRPGKSEPMDSAYVDEERRNAAWATWVKRKNDELDAQIRTALARADARKACGA